MPIRTGALLCASLQTMLWRKEFQSFVRIISSDEVVRMQGEVPFWSVVSFISLNNHGYVYQAPTHKDSLITARKRDRIDSRKAVG